MLHIKTYRYCGAYSFPPILVWYIFSIDGRIIGKIAHYKQISPERDTCWLLAISAWDHAAFTILCCIIIYHEIRFTSMLGVINALPRLKYAWYEVLFDDMVDMIAHVTPGRVTSMMSNRASWKQNRLPSFMIWHFILYRKSFKNADRLSGFSNIKINEE